MKVALYSRHQILHQLYLNLTLSIVAAYIIITEPCQILRPSLYSLNLDPYLRPRGRHQTILQPRILQTKRWPVIQTSLTFLLI